MEILWGIEKRLKNYKPSANAQILRPEGFLVVESRPKLSPEKGSVVYLVKRCCLDTRKTGYVLMKLLKASSFSFSGLKDALAIAYQYYSFSNPKRIKTYIEAKEISAWLITKGYKIKTRSHRENFFSLKITSNKPQELCRAFKSLKYIPGYFGPQRFGLERPNTHLEGLYLLKQDFGPLIREFMYRYPLESRRGLGDYEKKVIEVLKLRKSPYFLTKKPEGWLRKFFLEALQAYVFNRALSKAIELNNLSSLSEMNVKIMCLDKEFKVPAGRLPAPKMKMRSKWSKLLSEIVKEEGMYFLVKDPSLGLKAKLRPLVFPICVLGCRVSENEKLNLKFALPPGAYATIALWQVSNLRLL